MSDSKISRKRNSKDEYGQFLCREQLGVIFNDLYQSLSEVKFPIGLRVSQKRRTDDFHFIRYRCTILENTKNHES